MKKSIDKAKNYAILTVEVLMNKLDLITITSVIAGLILFVQLWAAALA